MKRSTVELRVHVALTMAPEGTKVVEVSNLVEQSTLKFPLVPLKEPPPVKPFKCNAIRSVGYSAIRAEKVNSIVVFVADRP